jgi:hypothetical protein
MTLRCGQTQGVAGSTALALVLVTWQDTLPCLQAGAADSRLAAVSCAVYLPGSVQCLFTVPQGAAHLWPLGQPC